MEKRPIVSVLQSVTLPAGAQRLVASGANVSGGIEIKTGHALAISCVAAALITFAGDSGPVYVNVPAGNWQIIVDDGGVIRTTFDVTSTATSYVWSIALCQR